MSQPKIATITEDKDWWRGAIIYQIYPRSFQDSNGDGIGDLAGIIERLPYIASLGVDAIWISPFFTSPMLDFGYDVSDYRGVDPMFGTLEEFDRLVEAAHQLGLKVMIDLVLSHSSDEHEWFKKSRKDKDNPYCDYYVWADAKQDGTPPNNWLSIFGGSAWEWDTQRQQYYLHNFLKSQPDLNFYNNKVQQELLDIAQFWLEKNVDGFRLDTINFYFHDEKLRDNPALEPELRNTSIAPKVNPYNYQNHIYDKNRPENISFLQKIRSLMDQYGATAAVGEVGDAQNGIEIMGQYTAGNDLIHMCYAFEFLSSDPFSASHIIDVLEQYDEKAKSGYACWAFSNHDVVRHASRWNLDERGEKLAISLLLSLNGSISIYQGEELGLSEAEIKKEDLQDPYGIEFWPEFKGRDGCRTPMVWDDNHPNAGFSNGKPWLPIAKEHLEKAVSNQQNNKVSLLNHYKVMIDFRKNHLALSKGELQLIDSEKDIVLFTRTFENEEIICAFNLGDAPVKIPLPKGKWQALKGLNFDARLEGSIAHLASKQAFFAQKLIN
ncbi:MAG: alpha-glucosidase family protein [Devosiaceae bacterium]|nr:alpha-glucosidase family protein [Devosiaceae bacterium]